MLPRLFDHRKVPWPVAFSVIALTLQVRTESVPKRIVVIGDEFSDTLIFWARLLLVQALLFVIEVRVKSVLVVKSLPAMRDVKTVPFVTLV